MTKAVLEHEKTGRQYTVMSVKTLQDGSQEITLKGEFREFTEPYSKERMKALGYVMKRVS